MHGHPQNLLEVLLGARVYGLVSSSPLSPNLLPFQYSIARQTFMRIGAPTYLWLACALNGRKVGNGDDACYDNCVAYFTKRELNKSNVLHELYHHVAYVYEWNMTERREETEADEYARTILKRV
jgi:hypothetical protein